MRACLLMISCRTALAVWCGVLFPTELVAQAVFHMTPSLNVAVVADSNLLARPSEAQADIISRVSPAVDAEYRSRLLTVLGRYTIDAEHFAQHTTLTTPRARQHAAIEVEYQRGRRLTIAAETSYSTTETPGELNVLSDVTLTRGRAQRLAVSPALTYELSALTKSTAQYAFTQDRLAGGVPIAAQSASFNGEHQVSRRDVARVEYVFRQFDFGVDAITRSHVMTLGWVRNLTRRASLSLGGGPRAGDGTVSPELSASVNYRAPDAELSLAYARTQTTLIGLVGAADTDSVSATAIYGRPTSLRMRVAPGVMQTTRAGLDARVYRLGVGASHPIGRALTIEASYDVTRQRGDLYAARTGETIIRHLMLVSFAMVGSSRVSQ